MPKTDKIAEEIWNMIQNRLEVYDLTKEEIMEVFDGLAANCTDMADDDFQDPEEGEWDDSDEDYDEDYSDEDDDDNFEADWDDFEEDIDED